MFTQEEIELTLIRAATSSQQAMSEIEQKQIDAKDFFCHQYEGHTRPYLQSIFKIACDYFQMSGSTLTENALTYLLKTKYKVAQEDVRHIMALWKKTQTQPYDPNDLFVLLQQARENAALRDYLTIPQQTETWLQDEGLEASCENTMEICSRILRKLRGGEEEVERLDMENASKYFNAEYGKRRDHPELYQGTLLGVEELDKVMYGLQGGQIFTVVAPSSGGKSVFMMNLAHNMRYIGKKKVAYISYEMKKWLMCCRHLSLHYKIPFYKFKGIKLSDEEQNIILSEMVAEMGQVDEDNGAYFEYCINTKDRSPEFIESELRRLKNTKGLPDVLIVDYLGAMKIKAGKAKGGEKRWEHQEDAIEKIFEICMRWNIPIIVAQQLKSSIFSENRKAAAAGKQVQFQQDAAFGAAALIDYSYYVIALQPNYDDNEAIVHPIKIRDTWFTPFCIKWDPLINKCSDLDEDAQRDWRLQHGYTVVKNNGTGTNVIDTQDSVTEDDEGNVVVQRGTETSVISKVDLSLEGFEWNPD